LSLRRRLFLTLCLVVLVGFLSIAQWIRGELRDSYSQVVEEMLVDYAHLIAAYTENENMSEAGFAKLTKVFERYKSHAVNAPIFNFIKSGTALEFYVTNEKGVVVFSTIAGQVGQDFSKWNDVHRTLNGGYGARSTRVDPEDSRTSVYHVAAPITVGGKIIGVATAIKTENSILTFLDRAVGRMFLGGFFAVLILGLLGGLILVWITLPLERLREYAVEVSEGKRGTLPKSNIKEVKHLGEAFESMRVSLEGKKTVEKYTQTLTHEMKSPLTAIKGAAELCLEEMDHLQRRQFLQNIIDEAHRSHNLLEQLLKIAALESKRELDQMTKVGVLTVLGEAKSALMGLWKPKNIEIVISGEEAWIEGDSFLLFQAVRNIFQNAIEFSENGTRIEVLVSGADSVQVEIRDQGVGIPHFAIDRIFEKFYSLERPATKLKSSGLGLSFVKEVMELHDARLSVKSPLTNGGGTSVLMEFPRGLN
jgi:two-component system sensor histidine kinase CreC